MQIIKLSAENVKRLRAVEITPDPAGNLVVIGGRNAQGKTSVLDSIMYALAGGRSVPAQPVRRGAEKAVVELDLGEITVRRTFSAAGNSTLAVSGKDGKRFTSPQAILDELTGKLSFDPLEFSRLDARAQADMLKGLAGLDFAAIDAERARLFEERTVAGRELKGLESRLAVLPAPEAGLPAEEQSVAAIMAEQAKAADVNKGNSERRSEYRAMVDNVSVKRSNLDKWRSSVVEIDKHIADLQRQRGECVAEINKLEPLIAELAAEAEKVKVEVAALADVDLGQFGRRCAEVETVNAKVRQAKTRKALAADVEAKAKAVAGLTRKIEACDEDKRAKVAGASFPIPGLSVTDQGVVTFNGLPLDQASSAEQLRISVAIGLALNPKLKVVLIRDGSLLDDDALKAVAEQAAAADAQVWMERVGKDGAVSVVIEDGEVEEQTHE